MSLILVANNYTHDPEGNRILEHADGSADYRVGIYVNQHPVFEGTVTSVRSRSREASAAHLLHSIANQIQPEVTAKKPPKGTKLGRARAS